MMVKLTKTSGHLPQLLVRRMRTAMVRTRLLNLDMVTDHDLEYVGTAGESQPNGYDGQFFHDDVDDAADFAEVDDGLLEETPGAEDEDDLWAGAQGLKKAKPETVNYAKRAKRVDVKRLKDSIWKGLRIPARAHEDDTENEVRFRRIKVRAVKLT